LKLSDLSRSEVAYLQAMYRLSESNDSASVSTLAKRFDVRLPTTIEILNKLERKRLVAKKPWRVPELTRKGIIVAEAIMHQHRIIELYFNSKLGLDSKQSCAEASKIDYLLNPDLVAKMCKVLKRPTRCLHGNAIRHMEG